MLSRPVFPAAVAILAALIFSIPPDAHAQTSGRNALDAQSLRQLEVEAGGAENVSLHPATSVPRFVRLGGLPLSLSRLAASTPQSKHERSLAFLREYAALFGIGDPGVALRATDVGEDALGDTHITYVQQYRGVPVFAGVLKTHFNRAGELTALSGTVIPHIAVDSTPSLSRDAAAGAALAIVIKDVAAAGVAVQGARLYIYRTGLARGVEGQSAVRPRANGGRTHRRRRAGQRRGGRRNAAGRVDDRRLRDAVRERGGHRGQDCAPRSRHLQLRAESQERAAQRRDRSVVANHVIGGDGVITMGGVDPTITIPAASVGFSNGNVIKSELAAGVNATLRVNAPASTDTSYRWLIGEDSAAFGGAIRDMWQPTCYSHPAKVTDTEYVCTTGDAGGRS